MFSTIQRFSEVGLNEANKEFPISTKFQLLLQTFVEKVKHESPINSQLVDEQLVLRSDLRLPINQISVALLVVVISVYSMQ